MSEIGFNIGGKHTLKDWGLKCLAYEITFPDKQKELTSIPGKNGKVDLSLPQQREAFEHRQIKIRCDAMDKSFSEWSSLISDIANHVQDEFLQITPDFDNEWYYEGWVKFTPSKNYMVSSQMNFTVDAYPYKLKRGLTSISRQVAGSLDVTLFNTKKKTEPIITTDSNIVIHIGSDDYTFKAGTTTRAGFLLPAGETAISIEGTGNVTIEYQEGSL